MKSEKNFHFSVNNFARKSSYSLSKKVKKSMHLRADVNKECVCVWFVCGVVHNALKNTLFFIIVCPQSMKNYKVMI